MSTTIFAPPPAGIERDLYDYLFMLTKQLNLALSSVPEQLQTSGAIERVVSGEVKKSAQESAQTLKSLIIKTAEIVRIELEVIKTTLESKYVAQSDLGTFNEQIQADIEASANGLAQTINYNADIFKRYRTETEGYIRQGIIGFNGIEPIIGVAIGQKIRTKEQSVDGESYEVIDTSDDMAVWTPKRLSFFVNGVEVAHFSNRALNVGDVIISGKLALANNKWEINHANGFSIKWIGGDGA